MLFKLDRKAPLLLSFSVYNIFTICTKVYLHVNDMPEFLLSVSAFEVRSRKCPVLQLWNSSIVMVCFVFIWRVRVPLNWLALVCSQIHQSLFLTQRRLLRVHQQMSVRFECDDLEDFCIAYTAGYVGRTSKELSWFSGVVHKCIYVILTRLWLK